MLKGDVTQSRTIVSKSMADLEFKTDRQEIQTVEEVLRNLSVQTVTLDHRAQRCTLVWSHWAGHNGTETQWMDRLSIFVVIISGFCSGQTTKNPLLTWWIPVEWIIIRCRFKPHCCTLIFTEATSDQTYFS